VDKKPDLISRLQDEADLCRNDGASDIAALLDDDVMTQHYPLSSLVREEVDAFEAAVAETHANAPQHLMEYRAALALVREHSDLWTPAAVKEDVFTSLAIEERRP